MAADSKSSPIQLLIYICIHSCWGLGLRVGFRVFYKVIGMSVGSRDQYSSLYIYIYTYTYSFKGLGIRVGFKGHI